MKTGSKILIAVGIVISIPVLLFVGFYIYAAIYYSSHDTLASYSLPRGHSLKVFREHRWDSSYGVLCKLEGPSFPKEQMLSVAGIISSDDPPGFTLHSATNAQVFWVTPDTRPDDIVYIVDLTSSQCWPSWTEDSEHQSQTGNSLLAVISGFDSRFRLYRGDPIGVKK